MEVGVGAVDLHRLVPHHRLHAELRLPVELDERRLAGGVDEAERVHAEALHEPERAGDRPVRHRPHHHVRGFGHQRDEVPEVVVRRLGLGEAAVGRLLDGVDEVGELDRVLDEEHRDVVADEIPVALLRVELDGEAADVAGEVERALVAGDRREAHEHRRALAGPLEQVGPGDVAQRLVRLEEAVGAEAAGVDDPLGDPLVVEVEDLLAEVEVLEQRRARASPPAACSGRRRPGCPAASSAGSRCRSTVWWVSPPAPTSSIRSAAATSSGAASTVGAAGLSFVAADVARLRLAAADFLAAVFLGAVFFGAMAPLLASGRRGPRARHGHGAEYPKVAGRKRAAAERFESANPAHVIEQRDGDLCRRRPRSPEGQG